MYNFEMDLVASLIFKYYNGIKKVCKNVHKFTKEFLVKRKDSFLREAHYIKRNQITTPRAHLYSMYKSFYFYYY